MHGQSKNVKFFTHSVGNLALCNACDWSGHKDSLSDAGVFVRKGKIGLKDFKIIKILHSFAGFLFVHRTICFCRVFHFPTDSDHLGSSNQWFCQIIFKYILIFTKMIEKRNDLLNVLNF